MIIAMYYPCDLVFCCLTKNATNAAQLQLVTTHWVELEPSRENFEMWIFASYKS